MNKLIQLKKLIDKSIEKEVVVKKINVFGYQFNYQTDFVKSISKYWFAEHTVEEHIAPLNINSNNDNRPGTIKESIEYIVVHDTASSAITADEYAHAKYVENGGGGTSWHYSVGEKAICHQIPDNEVAYHAGDQLKVKFSLIDTGVEGTNTKPIIDIIDNYYTIDSQKTKVHTPVVSFEYDNNTLVYASDKAIFGKKAPIEAKQGIVDLKFTKDDINDYGVRVELIDGKYYMGPTYYNATYKKIANRGGNLNSIGIETMVNKSSNLIKTWHRCAKLVAHLLINNNLDVSRVKAHHYFSGKNCPMTLRENNLWNYFIQMVEIEYEILKEFNDCEIFLQCDNEIITDDGLINLDKIDKSKENIVSCQIKIKNCNGEMILNYQTIIKCEE